MPMTINPSLKSSMDALRILVSETPKSGAVGEPDQVIALIEQLSELSKSGQDCPKSAWRTALYPTSSQLFTGL